MVCGQCAGGGLALDSVRELAGPRAIAAGPRIERAFIPGAPARPAGGKLAAGCERTPVHTSAKKFWWHTSWDTKRRIASTTAG